MRNERGITLVEVLAAITILSIVGVIIWQVFFQGLHYSNKSVTKNMLQQESNIVITTLTRLHQTTEKYSLKSGACNIIVLDKNDVEIERFGNTKYCYKLVDPIHNLEINTKTLKPAGLTTGDPASIVSDLKIIVSISESTDLNNFVEVETLLYRLKEGEEYE